jgi:hypothetical protein
MWRAERSLALRVFFSVIYDVDDGMMLVMTSFHMELS